MSEKTLMWFTLAVTFVLGACFGFWLRGLRPAKPVEPVVQTDTLYLRDTIRIDRPVPKPYPVYLPSDTVRLVTTQHDTVEVLVPMEQKHYSDSLYDVYVSGYKPNLDSLRIYQTTKIVTITETIKVPEKKRWGLGFQVGGTYLPKVGPTPYVGVGISYNLLTF